MRSRSVFNGLLLVLAVWAGCLTASAQTDIGLSLYGAFTQKTTNNGVIQSPASSAGGIFELRHIANPILGFEGTYSYNRANQWYAPEVAVTCPIPPVPCAPVQKVAANAHEITADWVPSLKVLNFRPFAVIGVGVLLHVPTSGQDDTKTSTEAVYVYGGGLDIGLIPHFGLRLQYRGNLYKAPDVTDLFTSTDKFTHTAEPMAGIYFRL